MYLPHNIKGVKEPIHRFDTHIVEKKLTAIMQFVVNSLVILPVLLNGTYGPYSVLNLHNKYLPDGGAGSLVTFAMACRPAGLHKPNACRGIKYHRQHLLCLSYSIRKHKQKSLVVHYQGL